MRDRLIIALDVPDLSYTFLHDQVHPLIKAGFVNYKFGSQVVLDRNFSSALIALKQRNVNIFLDLKLPDTPDTVRETVKRAGQWGIKILTVDPKVVYAATQVNSFDMKIISVAWLTSQTYVNDTQAFVNISSAKVDSAAGVIIPAKVDYLKKAKDLGLISICPGVRLEGEKSDNHFLSFTPAQAIRNGADYIVMGRSIVEASYPVEAANRIVLEMQKGSS